MRAQLGIFINVIVPIIIFGFFMLIISNIIASQTDTYAKFADVVTVMRGACANVGEANARAITELTIDSGVFIKQITNRTTCQAKLLDLAQQNKLKPDCAYECEPNEFCLCIGRSNSRAYGYLWEDVRDPGDIIPDWLDVRDNRIAACNDFDTPGFEILDESLCCAGLSCESSVGYKVYVANASVGVFDGLYCPEPLLVVGTPCPNGYRIEGIFKMYREDPENYYLNLVVE